MQIYMIHMDAGITFRFPVVLDIQYRQQAARCFEAENKTQIQSQLRADQTEQLEGILHLPVHLLHGSIQLLLV